MAEAFPTAWIEDPDVTDETRPILEEHSARVTWDAPIHSVQDIENAPWPPRTINIKPSRFGSVKRLFEAYDYCEAHDIAVYGGGQWELGLGRGHIQYLASLFHPDTPNDVAPGGYNASEPPAGPADLSARSSGGRDRLPLGLASRGVSRLPAIASTLLGLLLLAGVGWLAWSWYDSRLPGSYNAMDFATPDYGGGPQVAHGGTAQTVDQLRGPADRRA